MANLKFKQTGIRVLQSKDGDLLFADPRFKIDTMVTVELLDKIKDDEKKLLLFARQFVSFLGKHNEARWNAVQKDLAEISGTDVEFASRCEHFVTIGGIESLRKLEKDIYFWKVENGKIEPNHFASKINTKKIDE